MRWTDGIRGHVIENSFQRMPTMTTCWEATALQRNIFLMRQCMVQISCQASKSRSILPQLAQRRNPESQCQYCMHPHWLAQLSSPCCIKPSPHSRVMYLLFAAVRSVHPIPKKVKPFCCLSIVKFSVYVCVKSFLPTSAGTATSVSE